MTLPGFKVLLRESYGSTADQTCRPIWTFVPKVLQIGIIAIIEALVYGTESI